MLATIEKLLSYEMTIAEWIGFAVLVSIPSLVVGVVVVATKSDAFDGAHGVERVLKLVAAVLCWPVLLLPTVCPA
jgi:ABC-type phosphate transport system permease subunit